MESPLGQSTPERTWLYRVGAFGASFTVLLILVAVVAHALAPPPRWAAGAALAWFRYLQDHWLLGLLNLDLPLAVGLVLAVPLYLALFAALQHTSRLALIATSTALLGVVLHLVSLAPFEMLAFSQAYATATTEAERLAYLAAGEATLTSYYGTVFQISYVLGYLAYLLFGVAMWRSSTFGKAPASLGILTGVAGFGFYLPMIGTPLSVAVVLLIAVWNVLVARRLFALSRPGAPTRALTPA
jgi:hypothetical protein